ncbi:hypothetical protein IHE45_05G073700 [Dioscorea alata]|uniref:Uncharacterized protein n=1 Tax=Dioscorea alata TaxID=55571 RepID=A0ACB7W2P0_DIOAL|nr:hypothetical protein IHE45_05G073700 [Dioscorea alata]
MQFISLLPPLLFFCQLSALPLRCRMRREVVRTFAFAEKSFNGQLKHSLEPIDLSFPFQPVHDDRSSIVGSSRGISLISRACNSDRRGSYSQESFFPTS